MKSSVACDTCKNSVEELADFVRILEKKHRFEGSTEVKNVEKEKSESKNDVEPISNINEAKPLIKALTGELNNTEVVDYNLPKEEDVINYIISKELFEHNTIELQDKFLGRRLPVRENPTLYSAFDNIVRKARKHIVDKYNIVWDNRERKSYGSKTHVTVYKVRKPNEQAVLSNSIQVVDVPTSEKFTQPLEMLSQ